MIIALQALWAGLLGRESRGIHLEPGLGGPPSPHARSALAGSPGPTCAIALQALPPLERASETRWGFSLVQDRPGDGGGGFEGSCVPDVREHVELP